MKKASSANSTAIEHQDEVVSTIQEEEEDEDEDEDEEEGKGEEEEEKGGGGDKEKDEEELEKGEEEEEDSASSFSERPTLLLIMQEIRFNLLLFVFIPCGSMLFSASSSLIFLRCTYRRQDQEDGRPTLDSFITESLFRKKRSISSLRKDSYLRIALGSSVTLPNSSKRRSNQLRSSNKRKVGLLAASHVENECRAIIHAANMLTTLLLSSEDESVESK
ncbi:hypothetical protein HZH68_016942 [Vespula germanica]|uniref:Uncharacterized protein n=1 Tax=Vespula germanica TaxID=30212 RepID=A0A834MMH2_VESGE|nr:hypothetical protein HZH68_016942 [Vespula germanica]